MSRPKPTPLFHFTHIDHLQTLVACGLLADAYAQQAGCIRYEAGNQGIKRKRRSRSVPIGPQGVVADYVPFYFAPRSPMMFSIHMNNVETYGGCDSDLIYLQTTVEDLVAHGSKLVFTDRNATLEVCRFSDDLASLDSMIDWPLMRARIWKNTEDDQERRERRMAECLVHGHVPWSAISEIAVHSKQHADNINRTGSLGNRPSVSVRRNWYF
ncbi:DUF4433 domain-containing protein [Nocardia sp. CC227C]|uniref:type II toxin-antitoxin system toxin DNA ADP-ribosyl transferase DarT n=1 Tax=Nocardia sp. CC227C TaxID=3044562 RepID=UPI00278BC682|nr:DUF4433 domain-containing protein [Nocardia sp. CC227C]